MHFLTSSVLRHSPPRCPQTLPTQTKAESVPTDAACEAARKRARTLRLCPPKFKRLWLRQLRYLPTPPMYVRASRSRQLLRDFLPFSPTFDCNSSASKLRSKHAIIGCRHARCFGWQAMSDTERQSTLRRLLKEYHPDQNPGEEDPSGKGHLSLQPPNQADRSSS